MIETPTAPNTIAMMIPVEIDFPQLLPKEEEMESERELGLLFIWVLILSHLLSL